MKPRLLRILGPSFMAAAVLETLVFAVVDPADLHGFNSSPLAWSTEAVYTVTFFIFWAATSTASAVTALLSLEPKKLNASQDSR